MEFLNTARDYWVKKLSPEVANIESASAELEQLGEEKQQLEESIQTWTTYRNVAVVFAGITGAYMLTKILKEQP